MRDKINWFSGRTIAVKGEATLLSSRDNKYNEDRGSLVIRLFSLHFDGNWDTS